MSIIQTLDAFPKTAEPIALSIGTFDGVHKGHQALLSALTAPGFHSALLTFSNHPMEVITDQSATLLTTLPHKLALLQAGGIDTLAVLPFTRELSQLSARQFLLNVRTHLPFSHLVLGHDAAFGHNREGDGRVLLALAEELGFTLTYLAAAEEAGAAISSSRIRRLIQEGDLEGAGRLLGRPYSIQESVQPGAGRGKILGFHTANLSVENLCLPPLGVYRVDVHHKDTVYRGIANLGHAPTLHEKRPPKLEVHIFEWSGNLYGKPLEIVFRSYLRPERRFASATELQAQIAQDITHVKRESHRHP